MGILRELRRMVTSIMIGYLGAEFYFAYDLKTAVTFVGLYYMSLVLRRVS